MTTATRADLAPRLGHDDWMALAATEYRRQADLFAAFDEGDWGRPTDCTEWDVRAMVAHLLGTAEGDASIREGIHQIRSAMKSSRRDGTMLVDALSALQVNERSDLRPSRLVARFRTAWPGALRSRSRIPALLRNHIRIKAEVPGISERWTLGYFMDCIRTRDSWLHRVDLCRATDRPLELSPEHDGRIVADVAAEWAERHGRPFRLELTGPAGGAFGDESMTATITIDAVEFCRVVSGRAPGQGLLAEPVPF